MLGLLDAKKKVYVFRIDIWMNIFLSDDFSLSEEFYLLKNSVCEFFLKNAESNDPTIVSFYANNVVLDRFKFSVNNTFYLLL